MNLRLREAARTLYHKYSGTMTAGALFFIPLKLSLALVFLVPLILTWIVLLVSGDKKTGIGRNLSHMLPFSVMIAIFGYTSLFGLDPLHSLRGVMSLAFFSLTSMIVYDRSKESGGYINAAIPLLAGQTVAAAHSILESAFPAAVPQVFLGAVTESGQLALTFVFSLGFFFFLNNSLTEKFSSFRKDRTIDQILFAISASSSVLLAFSGYLGLRHMSLLFLGLFIFFQAINIYRVFSFRRRIEGLYSLYIALLTIVIPLCATALFGNLKRGPWAGTLAGGLLILALCYKRMIIPALVSTALVFAFVAPVRERLTQSYEHFYIAGGRNAIWKIGQELTAQYPLGIGYENSRVLRKFSSQIPEELRHFHSNILNILVETGWLGLAAFLWWLTAVFKASVTRGTFRNGRIMAATIGCAVLSWQIAGIVEYNFGDSEVLLIVFVLMGIMAAVRNEIASAADMKTAVTPARGSEVPERVRAAL